MPLPPLLTDLYELTMLAGYFHERMHEKPAAFDLFFRKNPFEGGYALFAGLDTLLDYLEELRFESSDIAYLYGLGMFTPLFLDFLAKFRFRGTVTAPPEGTVVFGGEPLLTVEGGLAEAQFVETALLNIVNFQTLVATKAARIVRAAGGAEVIEFGLRRAQGPDGGMSVARAARIGGVRSTSNVQAGKLFGMPVRGTHAHSWVMAFPDELTAFRRYAASFPDSCVLLVDTWDTLGSGIPNAVTVARELRERGHVLRGVRIDSGDLAYLSREARRMFDEAGFPQVKIVASNELDEHVIESMRSEGGRVDVYGVGTRLSTCAGVGGGALGGVYKLVWIDGEPRLKVTGDLSKATLPGRKCVQRAISPEGRFVQDVISLQGEELREGMTVYDPENPLRQVNLPEGVSFLPVRTVVMREGKRTEAGIARDPGESAERGWNQLERLPEGCLRLMNPHRYKVSMSPALNRLRLELMEKALGGRKGS